MSYWTTTEQNLGIIKAGSPKKVVFKALDNIPEINSISSSCTCTGVRYSAKVKELHATYANNPIPTQVKGPQSSTQRIDIFYIDGTSEVLIIKSTRIR